MRRVFVGDIQGCREPLERLLAAADDATAPVRVVLSMRADFLDRLSVLTASGSPRSRASASRNRPAKPVRSRTMAQGRGRAFWPLGRLQDIPLAVSRWRAEAGQPA